MGKKSEKLLGMALNDKFRQFPLLAVEPNPAILFLVQPLIRAAMVFSPDLTE